MTMTEEAVATAMEKYRTPAVALVKVYPRERKGTPGCWLGGGEPTLPAHIPWPMFDYSIEDYPAVPMHFLCQLNLAQFPRFDEFPEMPERGTLFFFFDPVHSPGGPETWDASKVLYVEEDVSTVPRRSPPPMPDGIEPESRNYKGTNGYWPVELQVVDTYPWGWTPDKPEMGDDAYGDAIDEHYEWLEEDYLTQIMPIPDDPTMHGKPIHLLHVSLGVNPFENDLEKGGFMKNAMRLLRLESDGNIGLDVGDCEPIEFWIPRAFLKKKDFTKAAMYLTQSPMGGGL